MPRCARRWRPGLDRGSRSPRAGLWPLRRSGGPCLRCGHAERAVVGRPLLGRGPGAAGRRMDDCRHVAAAIFRPGYRYGERTRRCGGCQPVADDGDVPGGRYLRRDHRTRAQAGQRSRASYPGGGGRGGHAGRGLSPAGWRRWLAAARDLGVGRLRRARGLAGWGMAAWPRGAVGAAAGGVCRCRRSACLPPGVVRRRGGHRGRPGWPGRGGPWPGSGGMAADGSPILPPPRRDAAGPAAYAA